MAAALVVGMGLLATQLTDISVIGSIAGGLFGTNMMFTIPPIMYIRALEKRAAKSDVPVSTAAVVVNTCLACAGFLLSAIGTFHSVRGMFVK